MNLTRPENRKLNIEISGIPYIFLSIWMLTPFFMTLLDLVMGALHLFPESDLSAGNVVYYSFNSIYSTAVCILGLFAIALLILIIKKSFAELTIKENLKARPWLALWTGLLVWAIYSTALSDNPYWELTGDNYLCNGLFMYFVYAALFVTGCTIKDEKRRLTLLKLFSLSICALALVTLLQETGIEFIQYCFPTRKCAFYINPNYLGYMFCLGLSTMAGLYIFTDSGLTEKLLQLAGFALMTVALLVNNTFGSYLAVYFGFIAVYLFAYKNGRSLCPWMFAPLVIYVLLSLVNSLGLVPDFGGLSSNVSTLGRDIIKIAEGAEDAGRAGSGRWRIWVDAVHRIKDRPVFGFGPEGFVPSLYYETDYSPHNIILEVAGYLGIPGLLMFLGGLWTLASHMWKNLKTLDSVSLACAGVVICYLANSMFGVWIFSSTPIFWLVMGMMTAGIENVFDSVADTNISAAETDAEQSEPLNAPDSEAHVTAGTKKKSLACAVAILLIIATAGPIMVHHDKLHTEKSMEMADLEAMHCADLLGQLRLSAGLVTEETEFYYDMDKMNLVETGGAIPAPYGMGTSLDAGGAADFRLKYEDYGEEGSVLSSEDYTIKSSGIEKESQSGDNAKSIARTVGEKNDSAPQKEVTYDFSFDYDYDGATDYSGMLIKVTVNPSKNTVNLVWIKP